MVLVTVRLNVEEVQCLFFSKEAAPELGHSSHHPLEIARPRELVPVMSSGGLDLIGRLGVEVLPDCVVVYGRSHRYKQVPNGMSEWDDAVAFEKDHPQTVAGSAHQQLAQPRLLRLGRERRRRRRRRRSCKDITTRKP